MAKGSCEDAVLGLDGGYVKSRHPRPERHFEIVTGKALGREGSVTRFAFVRNGAADAVNAARLALRRCGVADNTSIAILTDGDAGLRAVQQQVAATAEHILDWFHIAMRFTNLHQVAKGASSITDGGARTHAIAELERAKWRFWNGYTRKGLIGLVLLRHWAEAQCFEHIPAWKKLAHGLSETIRYLEFNTDSMPNYGKRYRSGVRISTGFVESTVNEVIAKRMVKRQQNALEQKCGPEFSGRPHSRPQWHAGRCVSALASRLPASFRPGGGHGSVSAPQLCMLSLRTPADATWHDTEMRQFARLRPPNT